MKSEILNQESGNEANASSQEPLNNSEMKNVENADETVQMLENETEANASSDEPVKKSKKKELTEEEKKEKADRKEMRDAKKHIATSILMPAIIAKEISGGISFEKGNFKFGLIKENRQIKKSDVIGFMQIIQGGKYDKNQPITVMKAVKLVALNYNITDLEGNTIPESELSEYLIVLDGQHRTSAFAKLNGIGGTKQYEVPNVNIIDTENPREYLADINMTGHSWNLADKTCVAAMATNNPILCKIDELVKGGFNASAATYMYAGFRPKPNQIKDALRNGDLSFLPKNADELIKIADNYIDTALCIQDMTIKMLTKRYFFEGYESYLINNGEQKALDALSKLTIDDFKEVSQSKEFLIKLNAA
jgi:hypothetical protein